MSLPLKIGLLLKKNPNRTFHLPTIHFQREDVSFREYVTDYQTWFQQKISIIQLSPSIALLHPQHFWLASSDFQPPKVWLFWKPQKFWARNARQLPAKGGWGGCHKLADGCCCPKKPLKTHEKRIFGKMGWFGDVWGVFYNGNLRGPPRQCQPPKK